MREYEMIINPKIIAHLHKVGDVGKGCPHDTGGLCGDSLERLGGKGHTTFPYIAIPYIRPDDRHRSSSRHVRIPMASQQRESVPSSHLV